MWYIALIITNMLTIAAGVVRKFMKCKVVAGWNFRVK